MLEYRRTLTLVCIADPPSDSLLRCYVGNLLIRPAGPESKSPYNFDIVLLDHGLYFDLDDDLRINYSKFLLSLILPASPETIRDRRKYASVVGNIDDDLVSFQSSNDLQSLTYT